MTAHWCLDYWALLDLLYCLSDLWTRCSLKGVLGLLRETWGVSLSWGQVNNLPNITHKNQNLSFFPVWGFVSISENWNFGDIFPSFENNFDISFRVILPLSQETELCLVLMSNTRYIVCLLFPDSHPESHPIKYLSFTKCYGKANKKRVSR